MKPVLGSQRVKWTVSVILSDPPCKDGKALIRTIPLNHLLIRYELDINVYDFKTWLVSIVVSLQKWIGGFTLQENTSEYLNLKLL